MSAFPSNAGVPVQMDRVGALSAWVQRWAALIRATDAVLDFAGGRGRNLPALLAHTDRITVADRDAQALAAIAHPVERLCVDLEAGRWPFGQRRFDVVVCCNYLFRPRLDLLAALVAPGGMLIYETFAVGHERHGRPSRPDFLLRRGELLGLAARTGLEVLAFEDGELSQPAPAVVQRICALRAPVVPEGQRRVG